VTPDERRAKNAAWMRAYYAKRKAVDPAWVASERARKRTSQLANAAWLNEIKLVAGCADCGYREHAVALDFDHRPGEAKRFNVAWAKMRSKAVLLAEIAKCDVVCSNCHRVRTHARQLATSLTS